MRDIRQTIPARFEHLASRYGDRPALIFKDRTVSFAELDAHSQRIALGLSEIGVSKGTHVGILMPNRPDWLLAALAAWRNGAVVVPLNTLYRRPELEHALRHADVVVLLAVSSFLRHDYRTMLSEICPELARAAPPLHSMALPCLRHVVLDGQDIPLGALSWSDLQKTQPAPPAWTEALVRAIEPCDDAAIFFTSGSTATPKGVLHTHASMLAAADSIGDRLGLEPDDRTWGYLPFFFAGGLVAVALGTLSRGGAVLLQEVFDATETLDMMERHGCTALFAWPHQAEALIRHAKFDRRRLRLRKGVGANTKWAAEIYPPDHLAVGTWGMTETASIAASSRFDEPLAVRAASHGRAMPGLEVQIVDPKTGEPQPPGSEGEIIVRGASVMRAYYKRPLSESFDAGGFFHTGDCGILDTGSCLTFIGRLHDIIKTAGVNVSAAEVEAVLMAHPSVKVAHVVPVPHPTRGENVAAFVVPSGDASCEGDLFAHCRARLASYKVPRHLFFCREQDLPVLGSGKVDRKELKARAQRLVE
jgi:acyl-CoA synthetase (AMP-forming)/AMP-acid ligase II